MAIPRTPGPSPRPAPTRCGARTRPASTPSRTAGAGSSARSITLYDEIVGWHTTKIGDRWAALEPIRQGVRHAFGAFSKEIARPAPAVRLGAAIHRRRLDQRGEVARSYHHAVVCRRAAVQRRGGTVHADAEGAMPLPAPLHVAIRSAKDHQRVHRALQHSMAHRTAQTSHAGGCAGRRAGGVTMVALGTRSHSDARIDDRRGGPPPLVSRKPGAVHARLPVNAARR